MFSRGTGPVEQPRSDCESMWFYQRWILHGRKWESPSILCLWNSSSGSGSGLSLSWQQKCIELKCICSQVSPPVLFALSLSPFQHWRLHIVAHIKRPELGRECSNELNEVLMGKVTVGQYYGTGWTCPSHPSRQWGSQLNGNSNWTPGTLLLWPNRHNSEPHRHTDMEKAVFKLQVPLDHNCGKGM